MLKPASLAAVAVALVGIAAAGLFMRPQARAAEQSGTQASANVVSSNCSNSDLGAMIRQLERAARSVAGGAEATAATLVHSSASAPMR